MKSLFAQAFTYIFVSILLVVILLSSVFFISIRRSVAMWNVNQGQRLENLLLPLLTQSYRENGRLENRAIHQKLAPFLTSNVFTYVFDAEKNPVYIYFNGRRIPLYDSEEVDASLKRLEDRNRPLSAVVGEGDIVGYIAADTVGFSHDVANRRFLQSVFSFLGWGTCIAVLVAVVSAFIFSKFFSKQARSLAMGLESLTKGNRRVKFPFPRSKEMHAIADSARHLQNKLHQEENLRRQWAEDVAHDLRTPISALKIQLEGLTDGLFEPSKDRLTALFEEVNRIEALVNDLRELNNVESPEMKIEREKIELRPFLEKVISSFDTSTTSEKDGLFTVECSVDSCFADRHYFHRALTNVLQNGIQYMKKGGSICIKVYRENGKVVFDISNSGRIDSENIDLYFSRLYRGNLARNGPGSGLGLPITRAIMRLHGGDATMEQREERTHVFLTISDSD